MNNSAKRNPNCKFTIEEEKDIIRLYQEEKLSGNKIAKQYNCDPTTINNILKFYNIPRRTLSEARRNAIGYTINENVFEKIDLPEKAYWLGVMYTDGFISTNLYTRYFGISVQATDIKWLEKFKNFLNYNGKVKQYLTGETSFKPGTPYVRLQIGNTKMVEDLEKLGVVEHKTKNYFQNTRY